MTGKWNVSVNVPGFSATYRNALPINRLDKTQKVEVTFTRTTAPIGQWATGFMTRTGPTTVRLPIALRPVSVAVPPEVSGTGTAGSVAIPLVAGMTGPLAIRVDVRALRPRHGPGGRGLRPVRLPLRAGLCARRAVGDGVGGRTRRHHQPGTGHVCRARRRLRRGSGSHGRGLRVHVVRPQPGDEHRCLHGHAQPGDAHPGRHGHRHRVLVGSDRRRAVPRQAVLRGCDLPDVRHRPVAIRVRTARATQP